MKRSFNLFVTLVILLVPIARAQQVTTTTTSTGHFHPMGTTSLHSSCPWVGGTWLGRDAAHGGCYISGYYHIGFDMLFSNGQNAFGAPVFAVATGVMQSLSTSGWTSGGTTNVGVILKHTASDGSTYYSLYGHLLNTSIRHQSGDVVTGGTLIGTVGSHSGGNHLHFGIFPSSIPSNNLGLMPNSSWGTPNQNNGAVDPLNWINTKTPKCQNGSSVRYKPSGWEPIHPNGTLIQAAGNPTVYVLWWGQRRPISSAAVLWELYGPGRGFDFRDVIVVSSTELNSYPLGAIVTSALPSNGKSQPDGRLIRQWGGAEISIVTDNGIRRPFASAQAFLNLGYQFCNVAGVSDYSSYSVGSAISQ